MGSSKYRGQYFPSFRVEYTVNEHLLGQVRKFWGPSPPEGRWSRRGAHQTERRRYQIARLLRSIGVDIIPRRGDSRADVEALGFSLGEWSLLARAAAATTQLTEPSLAALHARLDSTWVGVAPVPDYGPQVPGFWSKGGVHKGAQKTEI